MSKNAKAKTLGEPDTSEFGKMNIYKKLYRANKTVWSVMYRGDKKLVISAVFLAIFLGILSIVEVKLGSMILGKIATSFTEKQVQGSLLLLVMALVAAPAFSNVGWAMFSYIERKMYFIVDNWTTPSILRWKESISEGYYADSQFMSRYYRLNDDLFWRVGSFSDTALYLLYNGISLITTALAMFLISWRVGVILLLLAVPNAFIQRQKSKGLWNMWNEAGDNRNRYWGLQNAFDKQNIAESKVLGASNFILTRVSKMYAEFSARQLKIIKKASQVDVVSQIAIGIVEGFCFWIILNKSLTMGVAGVAFFSFGVGVIARFHGGLKLVINNITMLLDHQTYINEFLDMRELPSLTVQTANPIKFASSVNPPAIELRNVSFSYSEGASEVLSGISLNIQSGTNIAIVGENGAGKTTLAKLMLRLYDPSSGEIIIDGHDLKDYSLTDWYSKLGMLNQEPQVYHLTIEENIYVGDLTKKQDHKAMTRALNLAGLDKLVSSYKLKEKTMPKREYVDGIELSGGQKQRLALARIFYRDAPILILDEPTSAIDAKAEEAIFQNIHDHMKDKTTIIISHRFSTVRMADIIVVLEKGTILESGTHEQLMKNKSLYYKMFTAQAKGYR